MLFSDILYAPINNGYKFQTLSVEKNVKKIT